MTLLVLEELLDTAAVVAVVLSAIYWWKASHTSRVAAENSADADTRTRLNAKAATHAAIAATFQALAVLVRLIEISQ